MSNTSKFFCAAAIASVACALQNDIMMRQPKILEIPKINEEDNNDQPSSQALLKLLGESTKQIGDDDCVQLQMGDANGLPFTTHMAEMNAVPYEGSANFDPHNEAFASDSGMMLLDIPDMIPIDQKLKVSGPTHRDLFAQIDTLQQTDRPHSCSLTHDRNKQPVPDLYSTNFLFTDPVFPADDMLFWGDMLSEKFGTVAALKDRITFQRLYDLYPNNTLWGTDGIDPMDIRQGAVGNCWFMAATSALAEVKGRVEQIFLNDDPRMNPNGIYCVNIYTLGVRHTVCVDDIMPLQKVSPTSPYSTIFSLIAEDSSMWGPIIEKVFAKYYGNYEHLTAGDPRAAARALNGSPSVQWAHAKSTNTVDFLWNELVTRDLENEMMFLITPGTSDSQKNSCGLTQNHAFIVLGVVQISNGAKLVKMRNPWGVESYSCDYNDASPLWTPALKKEAGATAGVVNDGVFFMTIEDYKTQGLATLIAYDTTQWYTDFFLMLNDRTVSPGSWSWCGITCTRHELTITSSVAQTVYVTAHVWEKRTQPIECQKTNKVHSLYMTGDLTVYTFKDDARQMDPVIFKAGETKNFIVEWDWQRDKITKDWSLTAWGDKGSVTVKHTKGYKTDVLPYKEKVVQFQNNIASFSEPDMLQKRLNDFVTTFDIQSQPGYCGFRLREDFDETLGRFISVGAHNCQGYGVNLTLYMLPADWGMIEKEFVVTDARGQITNQNQRMECADSNQFRTCRYYLAPNNPRMGLMMKQGSYGLMTYNAQWVITP